jgi:hypothetical protein
MANPKKSKTKTAKKTDRRAPRPNRAQTSRTTATDDASPLAPAVKACIRAGLAVYEQARDAVISTRRNIEELVEEVRAEDRAARKK